MVQSEPSASHAHGHPRREALRCDVGCRPVRQVHETRRLDAHARFFVRLSCRGDTGRGRQVVTGGVALGIALLLATAVKLHRDAAEERERAFAALDRANRSLERRLAEKTTSLKEADEEIQRLAFVVGNDEIERAHV